MSDIPRALLLLHTVSLFNLMGYRQFHRALEIKRAAAMMSHVCKDPVTRDLSSLLLFFLFFLRLVHAPLKGRKTTSL